MRLTNQIKQQIVTAAIAKAGIPAEAEDLRLRRVAWAEAVRVDALGGKEGAEAVDKAIKAIEKIMSSIPSALAYSSGAIRHDSSMYVNCGGLSVRARFIGNRGDCFDIRACTVKPTVDSHTIKADHPLSIEFRQLEEEAKSLICKRETIETSVNAAMSGINIIAKYADEDIGSNCGTLTFMDGNIVAQECAGRWIEMSEQDRAKWSDFAYEVTGRSREEDDEE